MQVENTYSDTFIKRVQCCIIQRLTWLDACTGKQWDLAWEIFFSKLHLFNFRFSSCVTIYLRFLTFAITYPFVLSDLLMILSSFCPICDSFFLINLQVSIWLYFHLQKNNYYETISFWSRYRKNCTVCLLFTLKIVFVLQYVYYYYFFLTIIINNLEKHGCLHQIRHEKIRYFKI